MINVGVATPDVGTPLAVDGRLTRGIAVGVAVADDDAVNDGNPPTAGPAAATTKVRFKVWVTP